MTTHIADARTRHIYEWAAQSYLAKLPLEHFMEATPQATQRSITLESFHALAVRRPDIQCFNELLLQYPKPNQEQPGQVVPDNMIVVHPQPIRAFGSYDVPNQPVGPLLVLEYVSKGSKRKDYETNINRYEAAGVPYYLIFYPDTQDLSLFRLTAGRLASVPPDAAGRYHVPEIDLAAGIRDAWVRFWYGGELLPITGEVVMALDAANAELARMRAELTRLKASSNGAPGTMP